MLLHEDAAKKIIERIKKNFVARGFMVSLIQGEAGLGKTILLQNILRKIQTAPKLKVIQTQLYPKPSATLDKLYYQLLKNILPSPSDDWHKVLNEVHFFQDMDDNSFVTECISNILHLDTSKGRYNLLDEVSKERSKYQIVCELVKWFSQENNLVIILEDIHWLTQDDITVLNKFFHSCSTSKHVHIICTSRISFGFDHALKPYTGVFKLSPLTTGQSLSLLREISPVLPDDICLNIAKSAIGNPFFIKEYATWCDHKIQTGKSCKKIITSVSKEIPKGIRNILEKKLSALDTDVYGIVKICSVQGMKIDVALLQSITKLSTEFITDKLNILVSEKLIRPLKNGLDDGYEFSHELMQRFVYGTIPAEDRINMHREIVTHLRLSKDIGSHFRARLIAHHASRTNDAVLKYVCAKKAAKESSKVSQHKVALEYLSVAKTALKKIKGSFKLQRHELHLHMEAIESSFITGDYPSVQKALSCILSHEEIVSPKTLRRAVSFQGLFFWVNGDLLKAKEVYTSMINHPYEGTEKETILREGVRLSNICIDLAQYEESISYSTQVINHLNADNTHLKHGLLGEVGAAIYSCMALAQAELGNTQESSFHLEKAQKLAENSEDYFTRIYTAVFLSHALLKLKRYEEARDTLKTTLIYCNTIQSDILKPYAMAIYGYTVSRLGDIRLGEKFCLKAIKAAQDGNLLLRRSLFYIWYGEVLMLGKKHHLAIKYFKSAIKIASKSGEAARLNTATELMSTCQSIIRIKEKKQHGKKLHIPYQSRLVAIQRGLVQSSLSTETHHERKGIKKISGKK